MNYFEPHLTPDELRAISAIGLAHMGDAVYETLVRTWLCVHGKATGKELHRATIALVCAQKQAELAQRLQVSPSALGMYEQERREPSMQTLVKLSRELGVTTDYLLTGTPAEKERAELEGMLLGRIRAADQRLEQRRERPFSREELAVLFAAMLMEE